jgi:hypothetical protein
VFDFGVFLAAVGACILTLIWIMSGSVEPWNDEHERLAMLAARCGVAVLISGMVLANVGFVTG